MWPMAMRPVPVAPPPSPERSPVLGRVAFVSVLFYLQIFPARSHIFVTIGMLGELSMIRRHFEKRAAFLFLCGHGGEDHDISITIMDAELIAIHVSQVLALKIRLTSAEPLVCPILSVRLKDLVL